MEVAGMLHGKVLRSPLAHARIRAIDATRALEMEGVVAVLTGADLDDTDPYYGHAIKDRPIVALDRGRFAADPVAAAAATEEAIAEAGARALEVEYEALRALGTREEARAPEAPPHPARRPQLRLG